MAPAGIGIIRISGNEAVHIVDRLFTDARGEHVLASAPGGFFRYGHISDPRGQRLDEVMAAVFRAPHSYTGEDVVELQCHGGLLLLTRVREAVLSAGARCAEPGEFTKRAFLNGRIDLTQAEAVMDVIAAQNEAALQNAGRQLGGVLRDRIRTLREDLLHESAFIEAALDDPESYEEELAGYNERLVAVVREISDAIENMISGAEDGIRLRNGVRCAIIGRPNAGKSSLLNLLTGTERSIVTPLPGTTRDTVEESVNIAGITLHLIDTAGIRGNGTDAPDAVELLGIGRARQALAEAELVLFVADTAVPVTEEDRQLYRDAAGKPCIVIANKTDLTDAQLSPEDFPGARIVRLSARTGEGLEELKEAVSTLLLHADPLQADEIVIASARHKTLLQEAQEALSHLTETIAAGLSEDFYTVDLMNAYASLGTIIGEEVGDDLIDAVFSQFCMGK